MRSNDVVRGPAWLLRVSIIATDHMIRGLARHGASQHILDTDDDDDGDDDGDDDEVLA